MINTIHCAGVADVHSLFLEDQGWVDLSAGGRAPIVCPDEAVLRRLLREPVTPLVLSGRIRAHLANGVSTAIFEVADYRRIVMPQSFRHLVDEDAGGPADLDAEGGHASHRGEGSLHMNVVQLAGFIGQVGKVTSGCSLEIWLYQDADPDIAIPIRICGFLAGAMRDALQVGMPVVFDDGRLTGAGGIAWVEAGCPKVATPLEIPNTPDWARRLARSAMEKAA